MSGTKGLRHSLFLLSFVTRLSSKKNSTGTQSVSRMHFQKNALWLNYFPEFSWKEKKKSDRSGARFLMGTQNFFFVPRSWQDEKNLTPFLYRAQNFPSLFLVTNMTLSTLQYAGRVSYELRNRPRSPLSLCNSVVEHRSAESKSLRFDSCGLRIFCLSHARDKTKNIFF